ncbi:hypothetical protein O988_07493, partial [Pseudogymnoascus sp. VKM F-3808]
GLVATHLEVLFGVNEGHPFVARRRTSSSRSSGRAAGRSGAARGGSSDGRAKEWCERYNAQLAIREALEIEKIGSKGEKAELPTEIKALREEETVRIPKFEKAREVLLTIPHAATSLKLGSNPWPG